MHLLRGRLRFLSPPLFVGLSVLLFGYLAWMMTTDAREKGLAHPLASYPDVFFGSRAAAAS